MGATKGLQRAILEKISLWNLEVDEVRHLDNLDGNQCQQSEDKSTKTLIDQFKRR